MKSIHRRGDWPCPHVLFYSCFISMVSAADKIRFLSVIVDIVFHLKIKGK